MKRTRLVALFAVLAMVIAGCGEADPADTTVPDETPETTVPDDTDTTDPGEEPAPEGEAGSGGELTLMMWQAPSIVNRYLSVGTKDTMAGSLVLEPLANYGPDTEIVPRLVADVPTVENGGVAEDLTSITWTLQEGIVWSDGTPLTAADAVFTWEYCTVPETGCSGSDRYVGVSDVVAVDDLTIRVEFDAPTPYPYVPFVSAESPILQAAQFADCVGAAAETCTEENNFPIGTGPFMVSNFVFEDTVQYEYNPLYRDAADGKPFFGTVTIIGGGDATANARSVLEIGEADYAWNLQVAPDVLEPMLATGLGEYLTAFAGNIEHINLNQTNPRNPDAPSDWLEGNNPHPVFTGNPEFSRALSLAIDREELVFVGYGVAGAPTCNAWPSPPAVSTTHDWCLTQDIEAANAILDDLGYLDTNGNGIREHPEFGELVFTFNTSINPVRQDFQDLIEGYWREIGIGVDMRATDAAVYFGGQGDTDSLVRFDGDMQMYTFVPTPGGQNHFGSYTTAEITDSRNNWGGNNPNRYSNPEFDALFEELSRTPDPDERNRLIMELSDTLIADGSVIPLVWRASASAFANDIQGYVELNGWDSEFWNIADWFRR